MKLKIEIVDSQWGRYIDDETREEFWAAQDLESQLLERIASQFIAFHKSKLQDVANRVVGDAVSKHVDGLLAGMLDQLFQPTNTMGEPKGQPTSLREMFVKEFGKACQRKVYLRTVQQKDGSVTHEICDSYSSDRQHVPIFEAYARMAADTIAPAALKAELAEAVKMLHDRFREETRPVLERALAEIVGIPPAPAAAKNT